MSGHVRDEGEDGQHLRELAHMARLSSLGEIASELNHELAQPLAAIANYSHACAALLEHGRMDDARNVAVRLRAQAKLILGIVEGFRQFAQKGSFERRPLDLAKLVQSSLKLIQWEAQLRGAVVEFEPRESVPLIQADPILVGQVILNLLRNALDATGERRTPIVVTLQAGGNTVEVSVRDHGSGLTPEVKARLFEPFFTTKATGIGIGLSLSRRIIESHGGRLWGENSPDGQGALFGFSLPVDNRPL